MSKYMPKSIIKNMSIYENEDKTMCFKIFIPICTEGEEILVIGSSPNRVNEEKGSASIIKAVRFLMNKYEKVKSITIVNLVPKYNCINYINEELYLNFKIIQKEINKSNVIVAAWGNECKKSIYNYHNFIEDIYLLVRQEFIKSKIKKEFLRSGDLTKKGFPRHYNSWKVQDELMWVWE